MAKQYEKEINQRQCNIKMGGRMLHATILLLFTTTLATAAIIPDHDNSDCSTVICPEPPRCPEDSIALAPAFFFQSVDEPIYADGYGAFINNNTTATEATTTAKATTAFITTTNTAESAPQREKRAALPLFEQIRDDVASFDTVFQQQHMLQRCCGAAEQREPECQCAPCAALPKCAKGEVAVMTHKGRGTPGDCCARYVCQPQRQCADNSGVGGVDVNSEFWRDRCTKCNCLGRMSLCHNVCPQNDEDNEDAMLHGRNCFSEQLQQFMENGKQWLEDNDCTECSCNNGERQCTANVCRQPRCKQPRKKEGKCCPVCPETELEIEEQTESEQEISTWKYIETTSDRTTTIPTYTAGATEHVDVQVDDNINPLTSSTMESTTNDASTSALPSSTESSDASSTYHVLNITTESTYSAVDVSSSSEFGDNINNNEGSSISSIIESSSIAYVGNTESSSSSSSSSDTTETILNGDTATLPTTIDTHDSTTNNNNNNSSSPLTAYNESSELPTTTTSQSTPTTEKTTAITSTEDHSNSTSTVNSERSTTTTATIIGITKDNTSATESDNNNSTLIDTTSAVTTTTTTDEQHPSSETTMPQNTITTSAAIAMVTSSPQQVTATASPAARNYLYSFSTRAPSTIDSVSTTGATFSTHTTSPISATITEHNNIVANAVSTSTPFIPPESQPTVLQQTISQQRMPVVIIGGVVIALVLIISVVGFCYMRTRKASNALKKAKTSEAAKLYYNEHNTETHNPNYSEPNSEATKLFHNVPSSQSTSLCHTPTTSCSSMA